VIDDVSEVVADDDGVEEDSSTDEEPQAARNKATMVEKRIRFFLFIVFSFLE
jgi:hypothetical protein